MQMRKQMQQQYENEDKYQIPAIYSWGKRFITTKKIKLSKLFVMVKSMLRHN